MFGFGEKKKRSEVLNLLFEAILQNDPQKVGNLLLRKSKYGHKINPNTRTILNGVQTTPLCLASIYGYDDIVTILLELGAQVNFTTIEGMTSLHFAISYRQYKIAALLMENGANIEKSDNHGVTPIILAKQINDQQMLDILYHHVPNSRVKKTVIISGNDIQLVKTVVLGKQVWLAENLNLDRYRNGESIPEVQDSQQWMNLKTGAWCYYSNNQANGIKYGKLYNAYAVNDPRGLAPQGWHIPCDKEWRELFQYLGEVNTGEKMKVDDFGGNNESGFTALSSGFRQADGSFIPLETCFYCSSNNNSGSVSYGLSSSKFRITFIGGRNQRGHSIRCIKDYSFISQ